MREAERRAEMQVQKAIEAKKQNEDAVKDAERALVEEDRVITQNVYRVMRQSGLIAGVNALKDKSQASIKSLPYMSMRQVKISQEEMTLAPIDDEKATAYTLGGVDAYASDVTISVVNKEELASRPRRMFPRDYNPFDVNLHDCSYCERLKGMNIGERGALSLAADFVRGACPRLLVIDLTNCRIKTRGLGRLLYGIKLANISSLQRLVLKGNDIEPRGMNYIQGVISSATFMNLRSLDLRDNEMGDLGLDIFMKMLAIGDCGGLNEVMLHRNGITDLGFSMFMKLIPRIHDTYFPNIVRISLDGNKISPEMKRRFKPYPNFISC